jgi:hypothetical protein
VLLGIETCGFFLRYRLQLLTPRELESTWLNPRINNEDTRKVLEEVVNETPLQAVSRFGSGFFPTSRSLFHRTRILPFLFNFAHVRCAPPLSFPVVWRLDDEARTCFCPVQVVDFMIAQKTNNPTNMIALMSSYLSDDEDDL